MALSERAVALAQAGGRRGSRGARHDGRSGGRSSSAVGSPRASPAWTGSCWRSRRGGWAIAPPAPPAARDRQLPRRWDIDRARVWTRDLSDWCDAQRGLEPFRGECSVNRAGVMRLLGEWDEARRRSGRLRARAGWRTLEDAYYGVGELYRLSAAARRPRPPIGARLSSAKKCSPASGCSGETPAGSPRRTRASRGHSSHRLAGGAG